ncbi:hypothetical protein NYZ99_15695 [Maribacter litopenaei]|uniref:Uncharacterized protein n=1 Tax=Maribacter litopenaei TaxID=2976127 RepID=A0ABY5Y5T6_9FLAO|nr:hypothetical protein [Maribacter litopenaei]UWX54368.1 hypothetical protein NYZ99_15695 [Maribacter litopenaei]
MGSLTKSAQIWLDLKNGKDLFEKILESNRNQSEYQYSDWLSLDVSLKEDALFLNGISIANDSIDEYLGIFSNTLPISNNTIALAPESSDSFISFTFTDYKNFSKNQNKFLDYSVSRDSIFSAVEEIGISDIDNEQVILLKTYGTANISDYLNSIQSNSLEYQGGEIKELRRDSILQYSFYPLVENFDPKYATVLENTFAFSNSQETLEDFINSNKSGQTLDKTLLIENIKDLTTEESTQLSVSNSKGLNNNLNKTGLGILSALFQKANLTDYVFGSQIVSDAGFFHTNYFIKKITASAAEQEHWKCSKHNWIRTFI